MTRTETIRKLLALGPLQIEALLHILGGDGQEARASLGVLMLTHQVYCSKGWYQLNRPRNKRPCEMRPKRENSFSLQAVW